MEPFIFKCLFDNQDIHQVGDRKVTFEESEVRQKGKKFQYRPIINGKAVIIKDKYVRVLDGFEDVDGNIIITKCEVYSVRNGKRKLVAATL